MVPVLEAAPEVGKVGATNVECASTILLATDGTAQSEQAVTAARLVGKRIGAEVNVLTVVDKLPMPWSAFDATISAEYERRLAAEALTTVKLQVNKFGERRWPVEVKTGDPAETIANTGGDCGAKLLMVGLGGHGGTSRVFGSETALRLARISKTPVLAIEPHLTELPRRILVAMDFSEASIEAARLALEIAGESGSMVLAHVVPWTPTACVPEEWIRRHEESIAAQLSRVIGWLSHRARFPIGQRILYGRPGHTLLKYAEDLDVDLIATGTHGRIAPKRLLGGQTVDKLIRGARCSVLVFPAAAAFHDGKESSAGTVAPSLPDVG